MPAPEYHPEIDAALPVGPTVSSHAECVLLVGNRPEDLAHLRPALEASGYRVRAATSGSAALLLAADLTPDVIVLDARLPDLDGLELLRCLKADPATAAAPIVGVVEPADGASIEAIYAAGAVDHLTRPIRPYELLDRLTVQLRGARAKRRARNALDAFGHASMAVQEADGRCVWQTALARALMAQYFTGGHFERGRLPPELMLWLHREVLRRRVGADPAALTVLPQLRPYALPDTVLRRTAKRLSFMLHAVDPQAMGDGHWLIVMREADDAATAEP
jgi:CheY-like chemotaxis protein